MDFKNILIEAKKLCSYKAEIIGKIDNGLTPASAEISMKLGPKEYRRYFNSPDTANVNSVEEGTITGFSKITLDANPYLLGGDEVLIAGTTNYNGLHLATNYDASTKTFEIETPFGVTETGTFSNATLGIYKTAHAWLVLYFTTFTLQELKKDVVIPLSEKFDKGEIKVFKQSEIEILRAGYLRNAIALIGEFYGIQG